MAVQSPEHAATALVGRSLELERLEELLIGSDASVVYLHGIAGIGKSALLTALLERLREEHLIVLRLDCPSVEPTEQGFLRSLARSLGQADARADLVLAALAQLNASVVVALDHLEVFRLMDAWLRRSFFPKLAANVRILLVSRDPPAAAWFGTGWGGLFHSVQLAPLQEQDARLLLRRLGVGERDAPRLNRIARGHPLALTLAAGASMERGQVDVEEAAAARVVTTLTHLYLEEVHDPLTRRALDAACVLRRVTTPLLGAMLPGRSATGRVRAVARLAVRRGGTRRPDRPRGCWRRSPCACGAPIRLAPASTPVPRGGGSETRSATRRRSSSGVTPRTCST